MPRFVTCGPNEAIIVSGCCHSSPTIRAGGRVFVWPVFHRIQRMSLNTMTITVESSKVYSVSGVPITIKGVAQVKIQGKDLSSLRAASEMFLDKSEDEIMDIAKATLDGHQRSSIASTEVDGIYKRRQEFSKSVQQSAQGDLFDMGLTLVSYIIQEISDDDGYLDALGQSNTVAVRSQARKDIAEAKAFSENQRLTSEYEQKERELKYEEEVASKQLDFEILQAEYLKNHYENKAKSEKAGDLQLASMNQRIVKEEIEVMQLEKEKETELMVKRKELKHLEIVERVHLKAEYEKEREITLAAAYEAKAMAEAECEAAKIRDLANARAIVISKQKAAEADVLDKRKEAFKEFDEAAKLEMVLAILPRLTAEIAGPISECNKISSVSQDGGVGFARVTGEIFQVVEQVYSSVATISGRSGVGQDNPTQNSSSSRGALYDRDSPASSSQIPRFGSSLGRP